MGIWVIRPQALMSVPRSLSAITFSTSPTSYYLKSSHYDHHVDLLVLHAHVLQKMPHCLMCTEVVLSVLSCAELINTSSKLAIKKIRLICWNCSKLKINAAWHRTGVSVFGFDHNQHINRVSLLLTLNKCLSVGCERQVIMF